MARVTVELPALLTDQAILEEAISRGGRIGMQDELEIIVTEIKQSPELPRNRGVLQRALEALPPVEQDGAIVAYIVAAGEANAYAAVMDLGRRAGKPMSWKFLYFAPGQIGVKDAWRGGWVNRKLPDWVDEIATVLRDRDKVTLKAADSAVRATKKTSNARRALVSRQLAREGARSTNMDSYRRRACYLLARSIATRIRARGIAGRKFVEGRRQEIADRVHAACTREIFAELARLGFAA